MWLSDFGICEESACVEKSLIILWLARNAYSKIYLHHNKWSNVDFEMSFFCVCDYQYCYDLRKWLSYFLLFIRVLIGKSFLFPFIVSLPHFSFSFFIILILRFSFSLSFLSLIPSHPLLYLTSFLFLFSLISWHPFSSSPSFPPLFSLSPSSRSSLHFYSSSLTPSL